MKENVKSECTTFLVGKDASVDGSTIIARNEDGYGPLNPEKFVVVKPEDQPKHYKSVLGNIDIDLPENPLKYTATPDATDGHGIWAAAGINSENVAMTATETITSNSRILGVDPLVDGGLSEEDFVTLVLPYIHSAKDGVKRLGALLEKYGTYEMNAMAFSDNQNVWYFETIGGHHWAAVRIPDDAYVVAPNRLNITQFDFDSDDTLFAKDLPDIISKYHLNPDPDQTDLRHIFGSSTVKDGRYNNCRAWYVQKFFNPEFDTTPYDQDLPFICRTKHKITIEDVKFVLSSHYQNTIFDPYGTGTEDQKKELRPIGINRNQELHILQIRNDVPKEIAAIHWLAYGPNTFNAVVPFYANINDTPVEYHTDGTCNPTQVYWLDNIMALIGDADFGLYEDQENIFEEKTVAQCRHLQIKADEGYKNHSDNLPKYLEGVNAKMAKIYHKNANTLLDQMLHLGEDKMKLQFTLND